MTRTLVLFSMKQVHCRPTSFLVHWSLTGKAGDLWDFQSSSLVQEGKTCKMIRKVWGQGQTCEADERDVLPCCSERLPEADCPQFAAEIPLSAVTAEPTHKADIGEVCAQQQYASSAGFTSGRRRRLIKVCVSRLEASMATTTDEDFPVPIRIPRPKAS